MSSNGRGVETPPRPRAQTTTRARILVEYEHTDSVHQVDERTVLDAAQKLAHGDWPSCLAVALCVICGDYGCGEWWSWERRL